jgi:hypothetical protein
MEWIDAGQQKPDEGTFEVLVQFDEPFFGIMEPKMTVAYYAHDHGKWYSDLTSREIYRVTHWQHLPKPIEKVTASEGAE